MSALDDFEEVQKARATLRRAVRDYIKEHPDADRDQIGDWFQERLHNADDSDELTEAMTVLLASLFAGEMHRAVEAELEARKVN